MGISLTPQCCKYLHDHNPSLLNMSFPSSSPDRWKGDCGGKKQLWFPANYVEEISPSAAEPDRAVRITPANWKGHIYTFVYLKLNECTCTLHRKFVHFDRVTYVIWIMTPKLTSTSSLILFFSVKQEMTENSPLGDLLRGSVDVSSCHIGKRPLHFLFGSAAGLQRWQSPCHRASSFCGCHRRAQNLCHLCF